MNQLILIGTVIAALWLIRKDTIRRDGISLAIWIPTLWVGIISSRPFSMWLGVGGGGNSLDGSPADRLFYLTLIIASLVVLNRRQLDWATLIRRNWPIFLFYGFLLISVFWTNAPSSSIKRWGKEFGNILVLLVLLTEKNPLEAIRAVFTRCAILFFPLSVVFIRYFPDLGRRYSPHSGGLEITGVTTQKNTLGIMVLACGLALLWDWLERTKPGALRLGFFERFAPPVLLALGTWLLFQSDSKTSIVCFALGALIIASIRMPLLNKRISAMGKYLLAVGFGYFLIDKQFGISEAVLTFLGRDATFTGRTDVWRELLNVGTNPFYGTGFMSFWDDPFYQSKLPPWVAFSAHNGYIEVYIAGGLIGVALLAVMVLSSWATITRALSERSSYAAFRFSILVAALIGNFSESNFACMTPLGLLFLLVTIGEAPALGSNFKTAPKNMETSYSANMNVGGEPATPRAY